MQALVGQNVALQAGLQRVPAPLAAPLPARSLCPSYARSLAVRGGQRQPRMQECRAADTAVSNSGNGAVDSAVPTPIVKIDNQSDPFATVVTIEFGDRLGELLDTVRSLKNLGLNIRRAKIDQRDSISKNKFYITDAATSEKIVKSAKIEEVRLTILNNLLYFHPESAEELAWGPKVQKPGTFDSTSPLGLGNRKHVVSTFLEVTENEAGTFTVINLRTLDRPGLLVDVVRVLKDISINVVSAEVDTEGKFAIDTFYVTYHGEPLSTSMVQLVTNCLQYYLSMASVEAEESY